MTRDLVEIIWLDATQGQIEVDKDAIISYRRAKELLTKTTSCGRVLYEDRKMLILSTSENELNEVSYLAVPKGWILKKRIFRN